MSSGNTVKDGTGTSYWLLVDTSGRLKIVGGETEDAAVAGTPMLVGGRYDSTARTLDDGDAGAVAIDAGGRIHVVGGAAENAAVAGNPVLVAGRYDTSLRTLNDGDAATIATDSGGRVKVVDTVDVLAVTLSLDTNIYADSDVLADFQEVADAAVISGGRIAIDSIVILDKDDLGVALDLVFANASGTLGTENLAVSISDADADKIVGIVEVATGDYVDLVNSKLVTKTNVGITAELAATSLFVGAITRGGTPTYTASGITLKIAVRQL